MKLAKLMKKLGGLCFLLIWIPFGVIMFKGPLSIAMNGSESVLENMSGDIFFGGMGIWWGMIIILSTLSPLLFIGSFLVGGLENRKVITQGQDAEAKILALNDTGTRINHNPLINLTLEVNPVGKPTFTTEVSQTISVIHLPSFQPGKIINVKYVPGTEKVAIVGAKTN